jgi:hypothetical protein
MENISTFFVPCGHKLYMDKREKIEHDYWQVPRKGVKVRSREHRKGVKVRSREHRKGVKGRSREHFQAVNGLKISRKHGNLMKMRSREHGSLVQREGHVIKHEHITLLKRSQNT